MGCPSAAGSPSSSRGSAERPATPPRRFTARRGWRAWGLEAATVDAAGVVHLLLGLDAVAAAEWPAGARLRYRVEIGPALRLALEVENRGPAPFVFEEALHTYLAVDDVERITVTGLEGAAFLDETHGIRAAAGGRGAARRAGRDGPHLRSDSRHLRRPRPRRAPSPGNRQDGLRGRPWCGTRAPRARCPISAADEWPRFLCVESGNVGRGAVTVAPGARHRLTVSIRSEPWHGA